MQITSQVVLNPGHAVIDIYIDDVDVQGMTDAEAIGYRKLLNAARDIADELGKKMSAALIGAGYSGRYHPAHIAEKARYVSAAHIFDRTTRPMTSKANAIVKGVRLELERRVDGLRRITMSRAAMIAERVASKRVTAAAILRVDAWRDGKPEISVHNQWFIVEREGTDLGRLTRVHDLDGWVVTEIVPNRHIVVTSPDGEEHDIAYGYAQHVASSRTAAVKDLAPLMEIAPEWYEKQKVFEVEQEAARQEFNRKWAEAHADLGKGTRELLDAIRDALVNYFNRSGKGVRLADSMGSLVEVFIGSKDGVKRYQSKVSVQIALTFEHQKKTTFMLRNEDLEDVEGQLSPQNTIQKLLKTVEKADKRGMWDRGEQ